VGDTSGARADRARLLAEHAETPWAKRVGARDPVR
jgi:hypothetical protein